MPLGAPATILPCKDGYVWMMALESGQWNGLCKAMGDPEWGQAEIFQDMFVRAQNSRRDLPADQEWSMEHTKQEIMDLCQANGCPTTALFTVAEVADHPHLAEREYSLSAGACRAGECARHGRARAAAGEPRGPAGDRLPLLGRTQRRGSGSAPGATAGSLAGRAARGRPARCRSKGVRVANFGWGWLGPVAGQTLASSAPRSTRSNRSARVDINRTMPPFGGRRAGPRSQPAEPRRLGRERQRHART